MPRDVAIGLPAAAANGDGVLRVEDGVDSDGVPDEEIEDDSSESGPSDVSDTDESDDARDMRSLTRLNRRARSSAHSITTHKPCGKEGCEICARGKKRNRPSRSKRHKRK